MLNILTEKIYPQVLTAKTLSLVQVSSPLDLFTLLSDSPWSMWLDSCNSEHVDSRFDILVWQPQITLTTYKNDTHIHWINSKKKTPEYISQEDPLTLVNTLTKQLLGSENKKHTILPFLGGALGYFSYDLGRRFERLPNKATQDISLPEMVVGIYNQAIIYDNKSQQYWLVCPEEKRIAIEHWFIQQLQISTELNSEVNVRNKNQENFTLTTPWQANMDKASYIEKFTKVRQYLLSGDCYQINLAQRFTAQYQGDEFQAYLALRQANQAPFSAFIRLHDSAVLSVSPERFLQLQQGKVQSKPIKGTLPRSDDEIQDKKNAETLKKSIKDRAENVMIVDLLRNDISKVCQPGSVIVPKLFDIESFPAVHHLVSTVEGTLSAKYQGTDLLRGAFPGGSITGAPKIRAMEIIEELEPHKRSVYCGSIGYISACGTMDTSITIRTLLCEKKKIYCWAGGGLVVDSTAINEYQETFDKVKCILPVLTKLNHPEPNEEK
ncbi:MAG: aminodeoxychorismate synthase component I [Colwellia sp.]